MAKNAGKNRALDKELDNALFDDFDKFEHWVMENWKGIFFVCGAAIVIVTVVAIVLQIQKAKTFKIESAIANAKTAEELEQIIAKYKHLPGSNDARIRLSNMLREKKQYDKAITVLKQLETTADVPEAIKWRSRLNVAYIMELKKDKKQAAAAFTQIGNNSGLPQDVRNEANYNAGRLYFDLKDLKQAKTSLQYVIATQASDNNPMQLTFWKDMSEKLMNRIKTVQPAPETDKKTSAKPASTAKPAKKEEPKAKTATKETPKDNG